MSRDEKRERGDFKIFQFLERAPNFTFNHLCQMHSNLEQPRRSNSFWIYLCLASDTWSMVINFPWLSNRVIEKKKKRKKKRKRKKCPVRWTDWKRWIRIQRGGNYLNIGLVNDSREINVYEMKNKLVALIIEKLAL